VLRGAFDESSGHAAGHAILAMDAAPDAVFAANDMSALGCLFAFHQAGLRVPDDIAVAGFDDIPLARYVHPSLTTIAVTSPNSAASPCARCIAGGRSTAAPIAPHRGARIDPRRTPRARRRRDSS
jgi:LacI family transcriptional regulator